MKSFVYFTISYIKVLLIVLLICIPIRLIFKIQFNELYTFLLSFKCEELNILDLMLILALTHSVTKFLHINFKKICNKSLTYKLKYFID